MRQEAKIQNINKARGQRDDGGRGWQIGFGHRLYLSPCLMRTKNLPTLPASTVQGNPWMYCGHKKIVVSINSLFFCVLDMFFLIFLVYMRMSYYVDPLRRKLGREMNKVLAKDDLFQLPPPSAFNCMWGRDNFRYQGLVIRKMKSFFLFKFLF